jgi:hypothetical protein
MKRNLYFYAKSKRMIKQMHIFISLLIIIFLSTACNNKPEKNGNDGKITTKDVINPITAEGNSNANLSELPKFDFPVTEYNFGTVIEGEKVAYTFVFTNIGKKELIINNVKASCGCTSPKWTKEPIPAGEKGTIEVIFNSTGRSGEQNKTVQVFANTQPKSVELKIQCNVVRT